MRCGGVKTQWKEEIKKPSTEAGKGLLGRTIPHTHIETLIIRPNGNAVCRNGFIGPQTSFCLYIVYRCYFKILFYFLIVYMYIAVGILAQTPSESKIGHKSPLKLELQTVVKYLT